MNQLVKTLIIVLISVIMLTSINVLSFAEDDTELVENGFKYTVNNGEATVIGAESSAMTFMMFIPATLGGYPVTAIGDNAFYMCDMIQFVSIPSTVKTIGEFAFAGSSLNSISLYDGLETIGRLAFAQTRIEKIDIPDTVTLIDENAFYNCQYLEEVKLSKKLEKVSHYTFQCCPALEKVTFPENSVCAGIGNSAFNQCSSLKGINIPEGVEYIYDFAFNECASLTEIVIPKQVNYIGSSAFASCTSLAKVCYTGSRSDMEKITGSGRDALFSDTRTCIFDYCTVNETHDWGDGEVTLEPSCKEVGTKLYTCSHCGDEKIEELPISNEHKFDNDCDTECNLCEHVREISHDYKTEWERDESGHWHICSICSAPDTKSDHGYDNEADATCNFCGYVREVITTPSVTTTPPVTTTKPSTTASSTTPATTTTEEESTTKTDETTPEETTKEDQTTLSSTTDHSVTTPEVTDGNADNSDSGNTKTAIVIASFAVVVIVGIAAVIVFKKKK